MSREVKRVSLDFNWPIRKIWYGYLMSKCLDGEYGMSCDDCKLFAKYKNIEISSYGCPNFDILEPPKGDGWQMWQTTSEGSPISPVFESPEGLARWLADTKASSFGNDTATYDQWLNMINAGWAISMVLDNNVLKSGVKDTLK